MCILMTDSFMMKYEVKVLEKVVLKEGWFVIRLVFYQGFHSTNTSNSNTSSGTVRSACKSNTSGGTVRSACKSNTRGGTVRSACKSNTSSGTVLSAYKSNTSGGTVPSAWKSNTSGGTVLSAGRVILVVVLCCQL